MTRLSSIRTRAVTRAVTRAIAAGGGGPAAYVAQGVSFPTGAYLYSALGGASGADTLSRFTVCGWFRAALPWASGSRTPVCLANSLGRGAQVQMIVNSGQVFLSPSLFTSTATNRTFDGRFTQLLDGNWHHMLLSVQQPAQNVAQRLLYIDDEAQTLDLGGQTNTTWTNYLDNAERTIGRNNHPSVLREWLGDMADVWVSTSDFIDFTVEANRRKFITADKRPVDLGAAGELPTGVSPRIFVKGPASSIGDNRGTFPDWTVNGTPVDSSSNP